MDFDKDYYAVLGLSPNAEDFLIKAAYKALAQRYHPDKSNHSGDKMKAINEAYSILSDVSKRKQYDNYLKNKILNDINQNQYQQEEQNSNHTNQHNEQLVAGIVTLILNAISMLGSILVMPFIFAGSLYQKFTAYFDEKLEPGQDADSQSGSYVWIIWLFVFAVPVIAVLSLNDKNVTTPAVVATSKPAPVRAKPAPSVPQKAIAANTDKCIFANQADCVNEYGIYAGANQSPPVTAEPAPVVPQETVNFPNGNSEGQGTTILAADQQLYTGELKNPNPVKYQASQAPTTTKRTAKTQNRAEAHPQKLTEEQALALARKELEAQERREQAEAHYETQMRKRVDSQDAREQAEAAAQLDAQQAREQAKAQQVRELAEAQAEAERNKKYLHDKEQRESHDARQRFEKL